MIGVRVTVFLAVLAWFANVSSSGEVIQLTTDNVDEVLAGHDAVLLNFYASWCFYSQLFKPVYQQAAEELAEKFTDRPSAVGASVDCVNQVALETRFGITKYPTVKLALFGRVVEAEYRGKREVAALVKFVNDHLLDPTIALNTTEDWGKIQRNQPMIIAHIREQRTLSHAAFVKAAVWLKNECKFFVSYDGANLPVTSDLSKDVVYSKSEDEDFKELGVRPGSVFQGNTTNPQEIYEWAIGSCRQTIRELTFENAEALAEPGLPFLVLFRDKGDYKSLETFREAVKRELSEYFPVLQILVADGHLFSHPLHKVGKEAKDLPVILLDSFVHMYVFKKFRNVRKPGKLKQFIKDLESGQLHMDYHSEGADAEDPDEEDSDDEDKDNDVPDVTTAPESAFKQLQPSRHRYSLKKDEL